MLRESESPAEGDRRASKSPSSSSSEAPRRPGRNARRRAKGWPAWCIDCADPIDLEAVQTTIRTDREYVHTCGRVLNRGSR
jgi:hypothetical protein